MGIASNNVPETPLQNPLIDKGIITSQWSKWFASIGTFIRNLSTIDDLKLSIGSVQIVRSGAQITFNGVIPSGTYNATNVSGMIKPAQNIPVLCQGSNGLGICRLTTDGNLVLTITSSTEILINATFVAGKE